VLIPTPRRILVARDPVDFRKQLDGLAAVCEVQLREQPLDGTLFVFRNRRKTAVKLLIWTHGGFLMAYKKLEQGRFAWPELDEDRGTITPAELAALMEGIDLRGSRRLSRWNP
jgi:transposase